MIHVELTHDGASLLLRLLADADADEADNDLYTETAAALTGALSGWSGGGTDTGVVTIHTGVAANPAALSDLERVINEKGD